METKRKATLSWSGGKDSAMALYEVLSTGELEVVSLHTIINEETRRVGMHGVRERLIDEQAEALRIPLRKIITPTSATHTAYEQAMNRFYSECRSEGIDVIVFGDIFLEDLRSYREKLLRPWGIDAIYPLWEMNTTELLLRFVSLGFKTVICVANEDCYASGLLGATIANDFISRLPYGTDPCGERGEFHTFVYDAPFFKKSIPWSPGTAIAKDYQFKTMDESGVAIEQKSTYWFQELFLKFEAVK
jgi:uncharacterized protein (TIGR00290 family)